MCACFKQFQTESLKLLIKELLESKGTLLGEDQLNLTEFANPSVRFAGRVLNRTLADSNRRGGQPSSRLEYEEK